MFLEKRDKSTEYPRGFSGGFRPRIASGEALSMEPALELSSLRPKPGGLGQLLELRGLDIFGGVQTRAMEAITGFRRISWFGVGSLCNSWTKAGPGR